MKVMNKNWWKSEGDEENHTPRVWELIARGAEQAGDQRRATEAREAANAETRNCGAS